MDNFKEKLKIEVIITAFVCVILAVFSVLGFVAEAGLVELTPVAGDSHWQSMWRGMVSGASMGVLAIALFGLVRAIGALKDEKKLKKLYVKANDELQNQIRLSAFASSLESAMLIGLAAGLIIGYFHIAIGMTIIAVEVFHSLTALCFKLYYRKKYGG